MKRVLLTAFTALLFGAGVAQTTVVINTGVAGTPSYNAGPIYRSSTTSAYNASRYTYLYTSSELAAAGITPNSTINSLGWVKNNAAIANGPAIFRIYLKNSTVAAFSSANDTWANLNSGATLAYENTAFVVPATAAPNYITFNLTSGFLYTGGSLEISTEWDINGVASPASSGTFDWLWSTVPDRIYGTGNLTLASTATLSATTNSISDINDRRPFLQITFNNVPCTSPPIAGNAQVTPAGNICAGSPVTVNLSGNSTGSGQTYQLQSSATIGGSYVNEGVAGNSPIFAVTPGTPNSTTYYRIAVTCSGITSFSIPVAVVTSPFYPGGTYTINSAVATSGTNFQTFTAAINAVKCGIAGPVVFNVATGSGPYNEQVTIDSLNGTSATNTITINGNGATLQFAPTINDRHLLRLNGADYVTINNLNITATTGAVYGWGIHLTNGANFNTINNCTINLSAVTSTTQSNSGGIVVAGSATIITTDGNAGGNTITNNTITGGYQGIIINGTAGGTNAAGNSIRNNTINDFYANGIELTDNNGAVIANNDINRRNRTAVTGFTGVELGTGNRNVLVNANRIHDTHTSATAQTGVAYGVWVNACDADSTAENRITNNLVYNFNSTSGLIYGLYNSSSNGAYFYHNTIVLDNDAATAGTTRGIFQITAASNIQVKNNNIYITRSGTGIKHMLYFSTAPLYAGGIISNNNNLYIAAPAGTNSTGYYVNTAYASLDDWKGANGGIFDQQSISINPAFTGVPINYIPSNAAMDTAGTYVGVATDILNISRSPVKPDIGAYEFGANPLPVKLLDFSALVSKQDAIISWATATELNAHHFVVERSANGVAFTAVQTVMAKGNSTGLINYTTTDIGIWNTATTAKIYYRLKMVDVDGKFSYSRIVTLSHQLQAATVQVFPNPLQNELYVKLQLTTATKIAVTLTDMAGRRLLNTQYTLPLGNSIVSLPGISLLKSGVYQVQVLAGDKQFNFSVVK